jgi:two-component system, cell cycle sensor histidine kinase and response regulator CckA
LFHGKNQPGLLPYLLALGLVILALGMRVFLAPWLGPAFPFVTLYPAIFLVAYLWGLGPAGLATIVGAAASLALSEKALSAAPLGLGIFTVACLAVAWLGEANLRANRRLQAQVKTLREREGVLRRSETELTDFFENSSAPMHWVGRDGIILRANQAELEMLGYGRDEYVGHDLREFHLDTEAADQLLARMHAGEVIRRFPARLRGKNGQVREVLIDSSPYRIDGELVHTRSFTRDMTMEKQGHEALERLAAIVASSNDAIVSKTLDGTVTSWNAAAERIFGYPAAEMVGQPIYKLIPDELHDSERQILEQLRRGESVEFAETERIRKGGERIWISLSVSPVRDRAGVITGAASIKRDITGRRQAEAELRRHQEELHLAHQAARLGTWRWEVGAKRLRWDEGMRQLYGLGPDDHVRDFDDFIARVHPEDRDRVVHNAQQALAASASIDQEFRILLPDGRIRWLVDQGRVTTDPLGQTDYITGVSMDVTERRSVEERLRETQRLQAVGQLAGGIAHEANNQMTVVLGAAQFLLRRSDLAPSSRQDVEFIRQAAERTAAITQQLLAFSRRQLLHLQNVELNRIVESIEPVLRRSLAENHGLVVQLGEDVGAVQADPRQLDQVLLNLTLNARDAMPDGGTLTIRTRTERVTTRELAEGPPPGLYAVVEASDTGHGMDDATLKRMFEPFFTTKPVGQGTGLGLSVVHGIITQTGGYIDVSSELGRGTTFKLYLPVVTSTRTAEAPAWGAVGAAKQGYVALIVEDDELVRAMAARGLAEAGYTTLEAENGRVALDLLRSRPGPLHVVITDIGMPEMDGYELARRLEEERPDLPIIYMTGYGDFEVAGPFLRKPFSPDAFVRKVGEVLAFAGGGSELSARTGPTVAGPR